jgi:hypothetical protein
MTGQRRRRVRAMSAEEEQRGVADLEKGRNEGRARDSSCTREEQEHLMK